MAKKQAKNPAQGAIPNAKASVQKPEKTHRQFSMVLMLSLLLGLIAFIVYANTLSNGFVLDDHVAIKDNYFVKGGIAAIPRLLATPYHYGWLPTYYDNLYRPLSLIMFATEYQIFGLNPAPFHFLNILVYAGCIVLLFLFLDRFFDRKKTVVAFIASLLFALHPIHTEVVANIKSRDELLCFFFVFLCLNVFIKYIQSGKPAHLIAGAFCFLLSLLSKETSFTFVLFVPLIFFFYRNEQKKRSVYITAATALMAVIFLVARFIVLNHYYADHISDINMIENELANSHLTFESRMATAILILGYYIKLLFLPYPLLCDYSFNSIPYSHFTDPLVLISLALYISLFVFSILRLLKNHKDPYSFGILLFLVTISIFSNIPFLIGTTMAERFLFFGSVGFCLIIALVMEKLFMKTIRGDVIETLKNKKILAIVIPAALVYAFITINRNKDWSDDLTLYKTDLEKAPKDSRLNYYVADRILSDSLMTEKDPAKRAVAGSEAISHLNKAIAIYPDYVNAHFDLGSAYFDLGKFDSAEINYLQALTLDPKEVGVLYSLAHLYFVTKHYRESVDVNKKALEIAPGYPITYANMGLAFLNAGNIDSAIYCAHKAVAIAPRFPGSYEILASAYKALGNIDSMKKYEEIVRQNNPDFKP